MHARSKSRGSGIPVRGGSSASSLREPPAATPGEASDETAGGEDAPTPSSPSSPTSGASPSPAAGPSPGSASKPPRRPSSGGSGSRRSRGRGKLARTGSRTSMSSERPQRVRASSSSADLAELQELLFTSGMDLDGDADDAALMNAAARARGPITEVLVLSAVPGLESELKQKFGFKRFNVLTGEEATPEEEDEVQRAAREKREKDLQTMRGSDADKPGKGKGSGKGTPHKRRVSLVERQQSFRKKSPNAKASPSSGGGGDGVPTARAETDDKLRRRRSLPAKGARALAEIVEANEEHRTERAKMGGRRPVPTPQVLLEDGTRLSFCKVADLKDEKVLRKVVARARVIVADPPILQPYVFDASRLIWYHSTFAGVDTIMDELKSKQARLERQRKEHEDLLLQYEEEKEAMMARRTELQLAFDESSPLLREATQRVGALTKAELANVRTLKRPPESVRLCLEAIVVLLDGKSASKEWRDVLRAVTASDFKSRILDFDPFSVTEGLQAYVESNYTHSEDFTFEKMDRAFKACGSLARWLVAQLKLAEATEILKPIVEEVKEIKEATERLSEEVREAEKRVARVVDEMKFPMSRTTGFGAHIAEFCVGQIIMFERGLHEMHARQQQKRWGASAATEDDGPGGANSNDDADAAADKPYSYRLLSSLRVGIMGAGDVGTCVARAMKGLSMKTRALVRSARREAGDGDSSEDDGGDGDDVESRGNSGSEYFDEIMVNHNMQCVADFLRGCDVIINTLPSTPQTAGMLNSGDVMGNLSDAVFVNVGRGNVVSEAALVRGLSEGWIRRAILDVFETEPLPSESPLWTHPRCHVTPHIAGISMADGVVASFDSNLRHWLSHNKSALLTPVDLDRGY